MRSTTIKKRATKKRKSKAVRVFKSYAKKVGKLVMFTIDSVREFSQLSVKEVLLLLLTIAFLTLLGYTTFVMLKFLILFVGYSIYYPFEWFFNPLFDLSANIRTAFETFFEAIK